MANNADRLLLTVNLAGTFVFAVEGAMAALEGDLDFLGYGLGVRHGVSGGIMRDLLNGAVPPQSIRDSCYAAEAFSGGALVFFFHHFVEQVPAPVGVGLDGGVCRCSLLPVQAKRSPLANTRSWPPSWERSRAWEAAPCATCCTRAYRPVLPREV